MKVCVQLRWYPTHGTERFTLADAQPIHLDTKTPSVKYSTTKSDTFIYLFFLKIAIVLNKYSTESHHRDHRVDGVRHLMV